MSRLIPSDLKEGAKAATEERRALASEKKQIQKKSQQLRVAAASTAEKDRIWATLITSALNNVTKVFFKNLNKKEQDFIGKLGLVIRSSNLENFDSWLDTHLQRYKSELEDLDSTISSLEKADPFSEALITFERRRSYVAREIYSLNTPASLAGKSGKQSPKTTYDVELKKPEAVVALDEDYNTQYLFWLLDKGQMFFSRIEKKFKKSAEHGEFHEILIARPSELTAHASASPRYLYAGVRHQRGWVAAHEYQPTNKNKVTQDFPGIPYDYFSEEELVAQQGPEPEYLRYFLELLGYQCTLRSKKDESVLRVKWAA